MQRKERGLEMNILILNAFDKIQKILVEEFTQTIPTKDIVLSLTVAIIAALIINLIYGWCFINSKI